jgi:hypothetical protein
MTGSIYQFLDILLIRGDFEQIRVFVYPDSCQRPVTPIAGSYDAS